MYNMLMVTLGISSASANYTLGKRRDCQRPLVACRHVLNVKGEVVTLEITKFELTRILSEFEIR